MAAGASPSQAVAAFGFKKTNIPSAKLRKGGSRVNSHLFPLFAITTGWAGKDEMTCILRFYQENAQGLMKPPDVLKSPDMAAEPISEPLRSDSKLLVSR